MTELLTAAQMRAIEQAAIDSGAVTGLELMERAGRGVVEAIYEEWPEFGVLEGWAGGAAPAPGGTPPEYLGKDEAEEGGAAPRAARSPRRIADKKKLLAVVLCGPGNNGGDGFVVARLLFELGWDVELFFYGEAEKLPPDARVNYERWRALDGEVYPELDVVYGDDQRLRLKLLAAHVVVDAVFGTGLSRPLGKVQNDVWCAFDQDTGRIPGLVAIDLPSGLCSDSGQVLGVGGAEYSAFYAVLTVTFHESKQGHVLGDGPALCGKVVVKDIGLPAGATLNMRGVSRLVGTPHVSNLEKGRSGHKFSHGHALVLSGDTVMGLRASNRCRGLFLVGEERCRCP